MNWGKNKVLDLRACGLLSLLLLSGCGEDPLSWPPQKLSKAEIQEKTIDYRLWLKSQEPAPEPEPLFIREGEMPCPPD